MKAAHLTIREFVEAAEESFDPNQPHSFWRCESLFQRLLADPSEITLRLNEELRHLLTDPHYLGDWPRQEWLLHRSENLVLTVCLLSARRFIHVLPYYAFYGSLHESLRCDVYELPDNYRNDVFDPSVTLVRKEERLISPAESIRIESDRMAFDFRLPRPVIVLKLMTTPLRTLEWLISRDSLRAWQANDANLDFTQLRVAADVLGKFAHQTSLEPLKSMTGHPHHAVRWTAIQNLARVNRSEAIARLARAVSDPHPHIRAAAAKTLARLQRPRGEG